MTDENELGKILIEAGFKKQGGNASIHRAVAELPANFRYTGLNSLLNAHLDDEMEELVVQITKIKDSNVYSCEFYKK